jgi:hypothetical protein
MSAEYAKENKQNKLTAKNFKANMIEEQAESTEELIAALTEKHTQQIELLIPFVIGIICSRGIPVFLDSQTKIIAAVIGHGIVGKDIPIMARLAKARRWSKR